MSPLAINIVSQIFFYSFAAMAVICAAFVVFSRNPVVSILCLVLTFFATAGMWIMAHAEFLGLILVVVYVGAVMTLFLFVVMMLDLDEVMKHKGLVKHYAIVFILVAFILAALVMFLGPWHFGLNHIAAPAALPAHYSNVKALGFSLYGPYVLPFEVAGVILLVAMIAAIALAKQARPPAGSRRVTQNIAEQVAVKAKHRLRLVKDAELKKGE